MRIEVIESKNLVRFTLPDGREVSVQYRDDKQYGERIDVRAEGAISLLPIVGCNGIAVGLKKGQ